ncbi:hypothetical protein ACWELJ_26375 [Nocardia sp. NPDC004582]
MTRKEATAGGILALLGLLVFAAWWMAPGKSGTAVGSVNPAPLPPQGDDTLTYRAVTASENTGAVTALILGFMIGGAALIGLLFFSAPPPPRDFSGQLRATWLPTRAAGSVAPRVPGVPDELPRSARNQLLPLRIDKEGPACAGPSFGYSSIAPGAVLETVIRNSILDFVFFNRSTMRSMA